MVPSGDTKDSLAALRWLAESGGGEAMLDAPVNRLAERPAPPPSAIAAARDTAPASYAAATAARPAQAQSAAAAPLAPSEAITAASRAADAANTLDELRAAIAAFEGSPLKATASKTVFCDGNAASRILFIGEAPGAEEDRQGLPFVGPAGQLLDRMLAAIDLDRARAYITNLLPWRPPANRTPDAAEAQVFLPFLRRHIALAKPEIIILLGAVSAKALTGSTDGILKMRGNWTEYAVNGRMVPVLPTLHPAYLLRQPEHKRLAWRDLSAARAKMDALGLPRGV